MIESIEIANIATYSNSTKLILSKSSFIYGANGSGKTTISRIIANPSKYEHCKINWQNNNRIKTIVYNSDFVRDNFAQSETVKGVFTLGENQVEIEKKIEDIKNNIDNITQDIIKLKNALEQKNIELDGKESEFLELFWQTEIKYDSDFHEILTGLRNSKAKFKDRVKSEFQNRQNNSSIITLDELKKKYQVIYRTDKKLIPELPLITMDFLQYEKIPILAKKIVGSQDVSISDLIQELNNSDWIKQGQTYLENSHNKYPFCQQEINNNLSAQLVKYFDRTFEQDINSLNSLVKNYEILYQSIKSNIENLNSSFINDQDLEVKAIHLYSILEKNNDILKNKQTNFSLSIILENTKPIINEINQIISNANQEIIRHNVIVNNIAQERKQLTAEFWNFLIQEMKSDIQRYFSETDKIRKAINGLNSGLSNKVQESSSKNNELKELEKQITSIKPTADAINELLKSFGFTNFLLTTTLDDKYYKIIRGNGENASETLSEGERTFITFLYFYQFIKGSHTESGINQDSIIVIDDPISSLDSDILFLVSNLIRKLYLEMGNNTTNIKQLIILTHNVYFYKEITFSKKFDKKEYPQKPTYHIVRKLNNASIITKYNDNPINTSYELLWKNIRDRQYCSSTIQNILRKILENYFKILGGISLDKLIDGFNGTEQVICNSLCSWINDGSHYSNDDLFIATDTDSVDKYLEVFERIFELQGHKAHYDMMMNKNSTNQTNAS